MERTLITMLTLALVAVPSAAYSASDEELKEEIRERAHEMFDELERVEDERAPAPEAAREDEPEAQPEPAPEPEPEVPEPKAEVESKSRAVDEDDDSGIQDAIRDIADTLEGGARSVGKAVGGAVRGKKHGHHGHVHVEVKVESDRERAEALAEIEEFVQLARDKHQHQHQHRQAIRDGLAAEQKAAEAVRTDADEEEPEPDLALDRRLRIGFDGQAATGPGFESNPSFIGIFGGDLAFNLTRFLALGIGQIGFSWAGPRWTINAAPYLEVFFFIGRWLQPYAQAGAAIQFRVGGGRAQLIGAAPFGATGARIWIGSHFSIGPAARVYWVATEQLVVTDQVLPKDAVIITGGFDCHLHF